MTSVLAVTGPSGELPTATSALPPRASAIRLNLRGAALPVGDLGGNVGDSS